MMLRAIYFFLFGVLSLPIFAAHIVGGEIFYECLGNDNYEITLKIYRDCAARGDTVADFDNPANIGIYDAFGNLILRTPFLNGFPVNVPPETSNPCLIAPPNICVEEGTYSFRILLNPSPGGYDIVYQRCCRNATIVNIDNPNTTGATYVTHIPDQNTVSCNSAPVFNNFPPIVLCNDQQLVFDHSATDPDGDQLVYEFCIPFTGASRNTPLIIPPLPPPFTQITWATGFSTNVPLVANPGLSINPTTGLLTGRPLGLGQHVVGVCVNEFRNGIQIGETRRDFQFNIVDCIAVKAIVPVEDTIGAAASSTAGVYTRLCDGFDVDFVNNSVNGQTYTWDFGDLTTTADTSNQFEPTYIYPDTGLYIARLIVNKGFPCSDTTAVIVRIFPVFNTDFTFNTGCSNEPIFFTDLTSTAFGVINSWSWNFGDGGASTLQNPQYSYSSGGNYTVTLVSTSDKGCLDIESKDVLVFPTPEVAFDISPPCLNTPIDFNNQSTIASGNIASWEWQVDDNSISTLSDPVTVFNQLDSFRIKLVATSDLGCVDSAELDIVVNPLPIAIASLDTAICLGEKTQLAASGGIDFNWLPPDGLNAANIANPLAQPSSTTNYVVTVTDTNGCQNQDSVLVTVNPLPPTDAGRDTFVCRFDTFQLNGTGGNNFNWSPGGLLSNSTIANPFTSPDTTTTFTLTSQNVFGCENVDSIVLEVQGPITVGLVSDTFICRGESITLVASGGKYYEWLPDNGFSDNNSPSYIVQPDSNTIYQVTISNDCNQFTKIGMVTVKVQELPMVNAGIEDTIRRDEFTNLIGSGSGIKFYWSPAQGLMDSTSLTTQASPLNTTEYVLTMESDFGCIAKDSVTIFVNVVDLLVIPNAFSPNGDGANDIFRVIKYLNVNEERLIEFRIFNRWGNIVFITNNINGQWDGTHKGEPAELGTYVFLIQLENKDGDQLQRNGTVTLIR